HKVFCLSLDGQPIRGKNVKTLINSEAFKTLDDNDVVSLCCVGILQLVLLGLEDRRLVSNWILRRWPALYATQPKDEVAKKSYSITGFAWAFKTWILESFRAATNDYYTRYRRLPRIVAWSLKNKFYRNMLKPFLHRRVPDEIEAPSRWWVSSRAYFDGRTIEEERIPRHLNRNNYFEVPLEMYQEFEKQRRGYKQMMEKSDDMYEKMSRFIEDMSVGPVPLAKKPIIADQHYGISDLSGFQSYQGYKLPSFFWPQLVPHLCTYRSDRRSWPEGWLSGDHMNSWIQILIKEMAENDNWTLSKSGTICLHPENNRFMILTYPHIIETLDGSMRPYPSWKDVNPVYMPINVGGVHWVTGAINLADFIFYVFDSMESKSRMLMLEQEVRDKTHVINRILQMCGYFNGTRRQPHNF
nr:phospholipase-like protein [Tanacetum cinerariifolium]